VGVPNTSAVVQQDRQRGLDVLPGPLREAFTRPPPRTLPPGTGARCARASVGQAFWVGVALLTTGGFYTLIFVALDAPWQIPTASAAAGALGAAFLIAYGVQVYRLHTLLRHGIVVTGVVQDLARVQISGRGPVFGTSAELVYRFPGAAGSERTASTFVLWNERVAKLEPGAPLAVCCDIRRPRRYLALLAIA